MGDPAMPEDKPALDANEAQVPEDPETKHREQLEDAMKQADEAAKRFQERIKRMNRETEETLRTLDDL
jgi:DNA anti-recombination protein RmuC